MFCFELEFEDGTLCYIDGHDKYVIPYDGVTKLFYDIITDVKSGLVGIRVVLKGDRIVNLSCNNDSKQQKLMANLLSAFTQSAGKAITKAAVFDRNHLILSAINNFSRMQKFFVCALKPEQYKGIRDFEIVEDFKLLKKYEPYASVTLFESEAKTQNVLEWVSDVRYVLHNRIQETSLSARVALVVKFVEKRVNIIPVITNLSPAAEPNIAKIAMRYLDKKQYQGNIFINLVKSVESDEKIPSQAIRPSGKPGQKTEEPKGKKGISLRPKMYEEPIMPPYMSVRSMGDDVEKKR